MSIRTPTYSLQPDSLTYPVSSFGTSYRIKNPPFYDDITVSSSHSTKISVLSPINTPEFIEHPPMYNDRSYEISGYENIILTRYKATSINALDYDYFTVIDDKTKRKFNASDSIVRHACRSLNMNVNSECQVRSAFGSLTDMEIAYAALTISNCYNSWKFFPNETSYDNVLKLIDLVGRIQTMKFNESNGVIRTQIEMARTEIDRQRKLISDLEKEENEVYEKAADAMNILEENGYDPDAIFQEISEESPYTKSPLQSDDSLFYV